MTELDTIHELVALAAEASAILTAACTGPLTPPLNPDERAAWERRRAATLVRLAELRPEFADAAELASADYRQAEVEQAADYLDRADGRSAPQLPRPELSHRHIIP